MPEHIPEYTGFLNTIFTARFSELIHEAGVVIVIRLLDSTVTAAIFLLGSWLIGYWWLYKRKDNKHVSFSINYVEDGWLKLRPIGREVSVVELFPNYVLRREFLKSIKHTSRENPLLEFPLQLESAIMSTLQSYISDDFSAGFMRAASNLPTRTKTFVVMVAYEQFEDINVQKVRVIITHHHLLRKIPEKDEVKLEKPHQAKRLTTMELINVRYKSMEEHRKINHRVQIVFDCAPEDVRPLKNPPPAPPAET